MSKEKQTTNHLECHQVSFHPDYWAANDSLIP